MSHAEDEKKHDAVGILDKTNYYYVIGIILLCTYYIVYQTRVAPLRSINKRDKQYFYSIRKSHISNVFKEFKIKRRFYRSNEYNNEQFEFIYFT